MTGTSVGVEPAGGIEAPASAARLRPVHAVLLFVVTSTAFVAPALVLGGSMGAVENVLQFPPYNETSPDSPEVGNPLQGDQAVQLGLPAEFYRSLRAGHVQLWEPDIAGGTPLLTGVHNRILSPLSSPFAVLPAPIATTASVFLGVFIAQLGTYALGRRLGLGVAGAAVAGVLYGFCGPLMSAVLRYHEMFLLPAWLFALHGTVTDARRRFGFAALSGAMTASVWLAGFPAAAVFATYTAAAFVLYLIVSGRRQPGTWRGRGRFTISAGGAVGLAVAAGFAVAAIQLLPTLEFLDTTLGRERRYEGGHLPSASLSGVLAGRFFGAPQDGTWWNAELVNVIESGSALGLVALGLLATLLVGVRSRAGRAPERPLAAFALPVALAVGAATYFGGPVLMAFQRLPLLDESLFTRSRFVAFLMLALVAGYGADRLLARDAEGEPPGLLLRAQLALVAAALLVGLWHGADAVLLNQAHRVVAFGLLVPVAVLGVAVAAVMRLRRQRAVLGVALALAIAVELQWGAFGLTPFTRADEFYPDHPALDVIRPSTSAGGQYRFFDRENFVLYGGAAPYLGIRGALANWPAFGPYQEVIELSDPHVAATSEGKAVFEPTFSDELDLGSPALDAAAVGWYLAPLTEIAAQTGDSVVVLEGLDGPGPVRGVTELGMAPVRAIVIGPVSRDVECVEGFVDLQVGGQHARRPVRQVPDFGWAAFPVPDIAVPAGTRVAVSSTDCPLRWEDAEVTAFSPLPSTDVELVSVDGWQAYRRLGALPRLGLARSAVTVPDAGERLDRLAARTDPGEVVLSGDGPQGPFGDGEARFVHDGTDLVVVDVRSDGPGLLVLRDVAAPGWRAAIDGEPADVLVADHAFRAVVVPDGASTVEFRYFPDGLRTGIPVSLAGLAVLLALLVLHLRAPPRARRGSHGTPARTCDESLGAGPAAAPERSQRSP